jgi:hypothetical protein
VLTSAASGAAGGEALSRGIEPESAIAPMQDDPEVTAARLDERRRPDAAFLDVATITGAVALSR